MKIGRNDPCYCGSGKKYKKCCLENDAAINKIEGVRTKKEMFASAYSHLMTYEEVDERSTEEIIEKLGELGIPFNKNEFLRDVGTYYSAQDISEKWFSHYDVQAPGRVEDFPWFAAWVLWDRFVPPEKPSEEQLSGLIENGYDALEANDLLKACDEWLQVWEGIQYRIQPQYKTLNYLDEQYSGSFFIRNVVQDLEITLDQAGYKDPTYYEKRIAFCRSFCHYFPDEELIYHNMRRAIADTYSKLGQYNQSEKEFEQLITEVPNNPWGYIGLADMLVWDKKKEYSRAKSLYEKALRLSAKHPDGDEDAVQDRLKSLAKNQEK